MSEHFRRETIQVAAVAAAIVEDLDSGSAHVLGLPTILQEIQDERYEQNEKWGAQHHDPFTWLLILMEEVGEMAEEIDILPWDGNALLRAIIKVGREAKTYIEQPEREEAGLYEV